MSLSKYKRDKVISGVIDKGYSRNPEKYSFDFLWRRFIQEQKEITLITVNDDASYSSCLLDTIEKLEMQFSIIDYEILTLPDDFWYRFKRELADLSNFIDFLFDRLLILEKEYKLKKGGNMIN